MPNYTSWIKKNSDKSNSADLEKYVLYFEKHKTLFDIKELEKYNFNSLKEKVIEIDNSRITKHTIGLEEDDYNLIHHDDEYVIFRANTKKGAHHFAKHTKWCINSVFDTNFQKDGVKGYVYYFFIRKFRKNNELDKIAVTINNSDVIYFDQKDKNISSTLYIDVIDKDFLNLDYKNINVYLDCYYNYKKYLTSDNLFLKHSAIKNLNEKEILKYANDESEYIRLVVAKSVSKNNLQLFIKDPSKKIRNFVCNKIQKKFLIEFINDEYDIIRIDVSSKINKIHLPLMLNDNNDTVIYNVAQRIDKAFLPQLASHRYEFVRLIVAKRLLQSQLSLLYNDTSEAVCLELSKRLSKKQRKEVKINGSYLVKYYVDLWDSENL